MGFINHEYDCKLDAKGRLVLPAKLKAAIPETEGDVLMLMRGFEPCLTLYPMMEFNKTASRVAGLNEMKKEDRNIQRNFFRRSVEVELDSAGRILIPKSMLEAVKIDKEALVMGVGRKIEIWNRKVYDDLYNMEDEELGERMEKVMTDE